jgi:DNA-3-methyladenine glycosylase II
VNFTLKPRGAFDLSRAIGFLDRWPAGQRPPADAALRFAYCTEGDWQPVAVRVTQSADDVVAVTATASGPTASGPTASGPGEPDLRGPGLRDQVARILSLDVDATVLDEITARDPVVARLAAAAPGLRPVCFWTPWEAACWAVLSQRTSERTAAAQKKRIAEQHGTRVPLDNHELIAFPAPQAVLDATTLPGVNPVKLERLQGLASAALDGTLTAAALRCVPPEEALTTLQKLPGVGPFSAALILIRGAGAPDVFPAVEPRLAARMGQIYNAPESEYQAITEKWRPLRSWVSFWLRAATPETLDTLQSGVH